jgi:hypothetical protein
MNTIAFNKFIVVGWLYNIPYMLQGRDVMNWYFDNNYLKVYKNLKSAEKAANKAISKYRLHSVKVYRIYDADEMIGSDTIKMWEREQPESIVYVKELFQK